MSDDPLGDLVAASLARVEESRRDWSNRSRRLSHFLLATMTDQTGAIARKEPLKPVDFQRLHDIMEGREETQREDTNASDLRSESNE